MFQFAQHKKNFSVGGFSEEERLFNFSIFGDTGVP